VALKNGEYVTEGDLKGGSTSGAEPGSMDFSAEKYQLPNPSRLQKLML